MSKVAKRNLLTPLSYGLAICVLYSPQVYAQLETLTSNDVITGIYEPSPAQDVVPSVSLTQALEAAYASNPRIEAARQEFAISETDISLAKSGKKFTVQANGSFGYLEQDNDFTTAQSSNLSGETSNLGISLTQPLFRGFQTRNAISQATLLSYSAQVEIQAIEQQVFLEVVTAYLDVQREGNVLNFNLEHLNTLNVQLEAIQKRYELKDTSLTDVARSQSAVASALSRIADSRANYSAARSTFSRLTGLSAEALQPLTLAYVQPGSIYVEPKSMEGFLEKSLRNNASINAAKYALEASDYAVKQAKGARLPSVDFNSSLNRSQGPQNFGLFSDDRTTTAASANISVTVPIYNAGQEFDNIKRAKQVRQLREIQLAQVTGTVRDNSRIAWDRLQSARTALSSHEEAVKTAETAAFGTRKIYRSGLISAIDLIDTEQILLNANINHERAKGDYYVSHFTVLSLMGAISY